MKEYISFDKIITNQLAAAIEAQAIKSELVIQDSGYELKIILTQIEDE